MAKQNNDIEKNCATCVYGTPLQNTGAGVCGRDNEVVRLSGCCRHYEQDLLRLAPKLPRLPEDVEQ